MASNHHLTPRFPITNDNVSENRASILLNRDENDVLFQIMGSRCVSLASAVVQVLFSDPGIPSRWTKQFCGVACFVKDNPKKSFFIRVYDIVDQITLWEQELYHEINYNQALPFFHTFETDDRQAGLNFANEDEAYHFFAMVHEKVRLLQKRREENLRKRDGVNNNHVPKIDNNSRYSPQNSHHVSTAQSVQAPFPADRYNDGLNPKTVNNYDDKRKKAKVRRITKHDIGMPTNFVHVSHIGWDPDKGFEYDDSDPTLQELFKKAGIDMKKADAATRSFIYGFIEKELGGVNAVKKAVLVHPPGHGGIPPPPPRSQPRNGTGQSNAGMRPLPPPRTPPTNPRPPPNTQRTQPPPPPPAAPAPLKGQAPQIRGPPAQRPNGVVSSAPPPPPPPPPPGGLTAGVASSNGAKNVPPPPPMPSTLTSVSPTSSSSPDVADSRSAFLDEIRKGKELKRVEAAAAEANLSGRDKLLNEIAGGVTLKHVDPEKDSLGKNEANPQLDGMAAALARALAQRRGAVDDPDESEDDEVPSEDDEEWDC